MFLVVVYVSGWGVWGLLSLVLFQILSFRPHRSLAEHVSPSVYPQRHIWPTKGREGVRHMGFSPWGGKNHQLAHLGNIDSPPCTSGRQHRPHPHTWAMVTALPSHLGDGDCPTPHLGGGPLGGVAHDWSAPGRGPLSRPPPLPPPSSPVVGWAGGRPGSLAAGSPRAPIPPLPAPTPGPGGAVGGRG